jgi:predicted ATP-dependent Lon-type protease
MQYTYSRTNIYSVPMIMYRDSSIYIPVYKIVSASYFCLLTSVLPYYFFITRGITCMCTMNFMRTVSQHSFSLIQQFCPPMRLPKLQVERLNRSYSTHLVRDLSVISMRSSH